MGFRAPFSAHGFLFLDSSETRTGHSVFTFQARSTTHGCVRSARNETGPDGKFLLGTAAASDSGGTSVGPLGSDREVLRVHAGQLVQAVQDNARLCRAHPG